MASHRSDIDALNAIAVAVGAAGGHRYNIDALNAWAAVDGNGGHKFEIDALNEIAVSAGAAGGHRYNINALNAISLILEGVGGHKGDLAALNEIVDLPALSGGGGGGDYVASAVHLNTNVFLRNAALTASDSPYVIFAVFFRATADWVSAGASGAVLQLIDFYPAGDEDAIGFNFNNAPGANFSALFDDNPGNGQSLAPVQTVEDTDAFDGNWHSLVFSFDVNHDGVGKFSAAYLDRVKVAGGNIRDNPAFSFKFSGAEVGVPDTTDDYNPLPEIELADYQLFVGVKIVQDDNTILSADLDNFVTAENKPVDPATAAAAYGTQTLLFSGDASSFVTNQGSGGVFTLTGSLTSATTSPSD